MMEIGQSRRLPRAVLQERDESVEYPCDSEGYGVCDWIVSRIGERRGNLKRFLVES